jgi:hypothetical protein
MHTQKMSSSQKGFGLAMLLLLGFEAGQLTMWFNRLEIKPFTRELLANKSEVRWLGQEHSIRRLRRLSERPDTKFFELVQQAKWFTLICVICG